MNATPTAREIHALLTVAQAALQVFVQVGDRSFGDYDLEFTGGRAVLVPFDQVSFWPCLALDLAECFRNAMSLPGHAECPVFVRDLQGREHPVAPALAQVAGGLALQPAPRSALLERVLAKYA